jgi:hypothetical protein
MSIVCLVLLACSVLSRAPDGTARVSCDVEESTCTPLDADEEQAFAAWCNDEPSCLPMSGDVYVLRYVRPSSSDTRL